MDINEDLIIEHRRYFHAHPELGYQELETTKKLEEILKTYPHLEIKRPTPTGLIAILKGKYEGKVLAIRSDIDALAMQEEIEADYKSQNANIAHTCGHDSHMAMLLETCRILCDKYEDLHGTIKFIFQPAEEIPPGGALTLIASHELDDVNAFLGMHIGVGMEVGHIGIVNAKYATTAGCRFEIHIQGKGGHGGFPQNSYDPILCASTIVTQLQSIVSRNISPLDYGVISVTKFQSGNTFNIIPDKAELAGTIRTASNEVMAFIQDRMKEIIEYTSKSMQCTGILEITPGYKACINDPELVALANKSLKKELGEEYVESIPMCAASEDFSSYNAIAPGVYMHLGGGFYPYINHHPKFTFDEHCMKYGVKAEVAFAINYLK